MFDVQDERVRVCSVRLQLDGVGRRLPGTVQVPSRQPLRVDTTAKHFSSQCIRYLQCCIDQPELSTVLRLVTLNTAEVYLIFADQFSGPSRPVGPCVCVSCVLARK